MTENCTFLNTQEINITAHHRLQEPKCGGPVHLNEVILRKRMTNTVNSLRKTGLMSAIFESLHVPSKRWSVNAREGI